MTRHRIAVIGLGMAVTPHARSLIDLRDRVEVACAFSRSETRRQAFAQRFDFPTTGDLERIVRDPSIAAVMILTPPNTHLELVERFAAAGEHILLEKPVERSTERALRLVEAAEAAGVKLGVVFQQRVRGLTL
jgi:UDP-N-acetyl-2-amino-2-deoxyglucuronate dehydrogenase